MAEELNIASSCPFCGELDVQLYHRADQDVNDKGERYQTPPYWRMKCWSCRAEGPRHHLPGRAAQMWETRFPKRRGRMPGDDDDDRPPHPVKPKLPEGVA